MLCSLFPHDNDLDCHDLCLVDNDYSETLVIHA